MSWAKKRVLLLLCLPLFVECLSHASPAQVVDLDGYPVQYGQHLYMFPLNASLGGGFSFRSYNFFDYILLTPASAAFPATALRFAKALPVQEDILYTGTKTFLYNSVADWQGWNIWTVENSSWRQQYIYLNNERDTNGQFLLEKADGNDTAYRLKICPSPEYCKYIDTCWSGGSRWACVSQSDHAIDVVFKSCSHCGDRQCPIKVSAPTSSLQKIA